MPALFASVALCEPAAAGVNVNVPPGAAGLKVRELGAHVPASVEIGVTTTAATPSTKVAVKFPLATPTSLPAGLGAVQVSDGGTGGNRPPYTPAPEGTVMVSATVGMRSRGGRQRRQAGGFCHAVAQCRSPPGSIRAGLVGKRSGVFALPICRV